MPDKYTQWGAYLSEDGLYRYQLERRWGHPTAMHVLWVMLNPSTATGTEDDPTIRRCVAFSRAWGYDAMKVVNLWAYRATDWRELAAVEDPRGPSNPGWIRASTARAGVAVLAWGANVAKVPHPRLNVERLLREYRLPTVVLGLTRGGHPRHPLYVRGDTNPMPYVTVDP